MEETPTPEAAQESASMDATVAQNVLTAEKQAREARCLERVIAILKEENCRADGKVIIIGTQISTEIVISAYPQKGAGK
jgi:hypothetical protein